MRGFRTGEERTPVAPLRYGSGRDDKIEGGGITRAVAVN